jgi:MarR family transcriptional regulator, 2-MHQ and catechol-resistance regulon repressor
MTPTSPKGARRDGSGRLSSPVPEPLRRVGDDFEDEYPGASALATECFANLFQTGDLLMELHNRQSREDYQLSPSARQVLAVVEGAGQPLEPSVIAERVLITTGTMTSVLDTLEKRGLIQRMPHPDDRRKLLVDITPDAQAILDELLPSFHAREHDVISSALSAREQRSLLHLIAKVQHAALEAQSAPVPSAGGRQRPSRLSRHTPTVQGTRE